MNTINVGRVLLGGFVAGVVLNIGESLLNGVVLAKQLEGLNATKGLPPVSGGQLGALVGLTFVLGFVVAFVYAAIRPRFGAGIKTAVIAGLICWFGAYVYAGLVNAIVGYLPMNLTWLGILWALFQYPIAAIAGAWVYKEATV